MLVLRDTLHEIFIFYLAIVQVSRFCLQSNIKKLVCRTQIKIGASKVKTILRMNATLSGVYFFRSANIFKVIFLFARTPPS